MDSAMIIGAFRLLANLAWPLLGAIAAGAVVAGVFRVSTQIDDPAIGLLGRVSGFAVLLFAAVQWWLGDVVRFAARVWGGGDTYW